MKHSLRLTLIAPKRAIALLDQHHPLGAGGLRPSFALGIFWQDSLAGVMTWGHPVTNTAVQALGLRAGQALELRKFWLADHVPANSESRALSVAAHLIRQRYAHLVILTTYCDADEPATAYRAAGWQPLASWRYVREVRVAGQWRSIREINRRGGLVRVSHEDVRYAERRKWVLPLNAEVAQRLARLPSREQVGGSTPTPRLQPAATAPRPAASSLPPMPIGCSAGGDGAHAAVAD